MRRDLLRYSMLYLNCVPEHLRREEPLPHWVGKADMHALRVLGAVMVCSSVLLFVLHHWWA